MKAPSWAWVSVDDPNPYYPKCDECSAFARWAVANYEQTERDPMTPITRWFACGRHINNVLSNGMWDLDAVQVYDLTVPPERS